MTKHRTRADILTALEGDARPCVAALAEILRHHPRERRNRLSLLVYQTLAHNDDPSEIIDSLVIIDATLSEEGHATPWAVKLAPIAAELMLHAKESLLHNRGNAALARSAPIFELDKKTIATVPPLSIPSDEFAVYADRLLGVVNRLAPKRVVLYTPVKVASPPATLEALDHLIADLKEQRRRVSIIACVQ